MKTGRRRRPPHKGELPSRRPEVFTGKPTGGSTKTAARRLFLKFRDGACPVSTFVTPRDCNPRFWFYMVVKPTLSGCGDGACPVSTFVYQYGFAPLAALMQGRTDDLRDELSSFFASIPYNAYYQKRAWSYESHYHYTLYLIFRLLSCYTTLTEKENSRGRADMIVETDDYVYIFEFKLDGTAAEALKQIDDKGYAEPYAADSRKFFKIGVGFSSEKKNITECSVIER
ncbi:MAG: PD-(D/E)XK nuclease domain-containing protein [Bacteroidales bacterium]|nr:PD-(D/E)XK nuclease domain-containing protein [Bacteroidales bacterium]